MKKLYFAFSAPGTGMKKDLRLRNIAPDRPSPCRVRTLPAGKQYQMIGQTLSQAEASILRVGVPLLFPSAQVRARAKAGALGVCARDFARMNLVGVPTSVLELYCEDLSNPTISLESLFICRLSVGERYGVGAVLITLITGASSLMPFTPTLVPHFTVGVFLLTCFSVWLLTSDSYRRQTFFRVLSDELKRRNGKLRPNTDCLNLALANRLQRTGS